MENMPSRSGVGIFSVKSETVEYDSSHALVASPSSAASTVCTSSSTVATISNVQAEAGPENGDGDKSNKDDDVKTILIDCGHCTGALEVGLSTTVAGLYQKILEDFDKEMIPGGGIVGQEGEFSFRIWIRGVQPTKKQAERLTVDDIIRRNLGVQLVENKAKRKEAPPTQTVKEGALVSPSASTSSQSRVQNSFANENGKRFRENQEEYDESRGVHLNESNKTETHMLLSSSQGEQQEQKQKGIQRKAPPGAFPNNHLDKTCPSDPCYENPSNEDDFGKMGCDDGDCKFDDNDNVLDNDQVVEDFKKAPATVFENDNLHAKYDSALKKSCQTLLGVKNMITFPFCSEARSEEWKKEIQDQLSSVTMGPKTVVGVLGSTGVGKSSLLNAMLDEAAVLPTSGSRGCTAAVVELTYNQDLVQDTIGAKRTPSTNPVAAKKIPVYKGKVEFMKLEDWTTELKFLVDECSTLENTICTSCPEEENRPDAAVAWAKINQVYGKGTMASFSKESTSSVFHQLSTNTRVVNLLTPKPNSMEPYNAIYIEEGLIDLSDAAETVLCEYDKMGLRTRRNLKRWAKSFRSKINDHVYRKGNGDEVQTWPLIRYVSLQGPWNVLSSGGILVDLPGVRDVNAARARVSERYLQNCNQIWVVAPIKRAVDDGTAKELMGEQFKRRLLMDGQYGNIAFVCTQTDDCEATEIMRDHEDIAFRVPGRWEKMTGLRDKINDHETQLADLQQQQEDLKLAADEAKELLEEITSELEDAKNAVSTKQAAGNDNGDDDEDFPPDNDDKDKDIPLDNDDGDKEFPLENDDDDKEFPMDNGEVVTRKSTTKKVDEGIVQELEVQISDQKKTVGKTKQALSSWKSTHNGNIDALTINCSKLQRKLKVMCAKVRNEYSTKCLQEDFNTGLREVYSNAHETYEDDKNEIAIPTEISLPVFCISANDYLKITGIKPSSDGPANCFSSPVDTQIQSLRKFVHATTASRRIAYIKTFVHRASDILDRVKLLASDSKSYGGGSIEQKIRCKDVFVAETESLSNKLREIASDFEKNARQQIMCTLKPSLASGARKAQSSAMPTVDSWGSKWRRTKHERNAERNGLHYGTYFATARRDGVYASAALGPINLNAELTAPMEVKFTPAWQSIMDGAVHSLLSKSERQAIDLFNKLDHELFNEFCSIGINKAQIARLVSISSSNCANAVRTCFAAMRDKATEDQRKLSRSLLPRVQQSMQASYVAAINVPGGVGRFNRMKSAMHFSSRGAINGVFNECMFELLIAVEAMVSNLSEKIMLLKERISVSLSNVYSILWDDQNVGMGVDPICQQQMLTSRAACLPILNRLRKQQDEVMKVLGMKRPVLDLEIAGVVTWEEKNKKKMQTAKRNGAFVELLDDSEGRKEATGNTIIGFSAVKQEDDSKTTKSDPINIKMEPSTSYDGKGTSNDPIDMVTSKDDVRYSI